MQGWHLHGLRLLVFLQQAVLGAVELWLSCSRQCLVLFNCCWVAAGSGSVWCCSIVVGLLD